MDIVIKSQGYSLVELAQVAGHVLRVTVNADTSYAFQSVYKIDVWSPVTLSWNLVWAYDGAGYKAPSNHGPRAEIERYDFVTEMYDSLVDQAAKILG